MLGLPRPKLLGVDGGREGASRFQVRDQDALVRAEDGRRLGHEVHAAEHDLSGLCCRGAPGQLQGVAHEVSDVLDPGHLVVVGQDHCVSPGGELADLIRPCGERGPLGPERFFDDGHRPIPPEPQHNGKRG